MRTRILALFFALVFAHAAFAADCEDHQISTTPGAECFRLLNDITAASGGPISYNIERLLDGGYSSICFAVGQTDCTDGEVTIKSALATSSPFENDLFTSGPLVLDVNTTPTGETLRCIMKGQDNPPGVDLRLYWVDGVCAAQGFDILGIRYR